MPKEYRTLRGFLAGAENDEEPYFAFSATLRIFGDIAELDEISKTLGMEPTHTHKKGTRRDGAAAPYPHDMWSYTPALESSEPLGRHIDALWAQLKPHRQYLKMLKQSLTVDVFLGYRSNSDTAGVEIPHTSLEIFSELEIPFGLSIIVT